MSQSAKCEASLAADSHTFAALLVDEDFVLITAINHTLGGAIAIERQNGRNAEHGAVRRILRKGVL
ncbi:MAG TPA: hypothetical protein VMA30_12840 [Xanthobacteraceae bacterium]|nr:hypothetical protein [Xanthobacteraceae bacterium]